MKIVAAGSRPMKNVAAGSRRMKIPRRKPPKDDCSMQGPILKTDARLRIRSSTTRAGLSSENSFFIPETPLTQHRRISRPSGCAGKLRGRWSLKEQWKFSERRWILWSRWTNCPRHGAPRHCVHHGSTSEEPRMEAALEGDLYRQSN